MTGLDIHKDIVSLYITERLCCCCCIVSLYIILKGACFSFLARAIAFSMTLRHVSWKHMFTQPRRINQDVMHMHLRSLSHNCTRYANKIKTAYAAENKRQTFLRECAFLPNPSSPASNAFFR